jgi:anti-sigma regulatory factor (Ser/Thr protein kinase)
MCEPAVPGCIVLSALEPSAIPHGDHVVQFYERDDDLVAPVSGYLTDGWRHGGVGVVMATPAHRNAVVSHLHGQGVDVVRACRDGTLALFDAEAMLERLMRDGHVDRRAFFDVVGGVVRSAATGAGRPVRAYGEMVARLWDDGNVGAALELEALWNELGDELPFSLYCGYHSDSVAGHEHADALHEVCRLHGAIVSGPDEAAVTSAEFPLERAAATATRVLVSEAMERWGHPETVVSDAGLVATELAANAILHAETPFRVSVQRIGPMVRISVRDGATAIPAVLPPDPRRFTGRGMHLIGTVARRWGVDVATDGKTVWAGLVR